jgi:hypothetical protein
MAKLDGTHLALGVVAAVAAAGAVASRSRGSRALSSMTAVAGLDPSQPWKAMVGAAKGGPSQEKWKTAFRNYPLDIDLHVVEDKCEADAWLCRTPRPLPGKLNLLVLARTFSANPQMARAVEQLRKKAPSGAIALMTPFTTMHRVFDASFLSEMDRTAPALMLTDQLSELMSSGKRDEFLDSKRSTTFSKWGDEDCIEHQDPGCRKRLREKWESARSVYIESRELLVTDRYFIDATEAFYDAMAPYADDVEYDGGTFTRVVASLTCPTAAGRLLRLTDYAQAMADCYATWAVANRNPLVRLTVDDLRKFSVDNQIDRWLKSIGGQQNTTDMAIKRYREKLEQVAVPVLRWVVENDKSSAFAKAIAAGKKLHARREPLIKACNDVLSIQRTLVI